jgi:hypothetical protein
MRRGYVVLMRWMVIHEYGVLGGALNLNIYIVFFKQNFSMQLLFVRSHEKQPQCSEIALTVLMFCIVTQSA